MKRKQSVQKLLSLLLQIPQLVKANNILGRLPMDELIGKTERDLYTKLTPVCHFRLLNEWLLHKVKGRLFSYQLAPRGLDCSQGSVTVATSLYLVSQPIDAEFRTELVMPFKQQKREITVNVYAYELSPCMWTLYHGLWTRGFHSNSSLIQLATIISYLSMDCQATLRVSTYAGDQPGKLSPQRHCQLTLVSQATESGSIVTWLSTQATPHMHLVHKYMYTLVQHVAHCQSSTQLLLSVPNLQLSIQTH